MPVEPLHFNGVPIAPWIRPRLVYAQRYGWKGRVLSGYRTPEHQRVVGEAYARSLGRSVADVYPNGVTASAHCRLVHPGGGVDVTDWQGLRRAMDLWKRAGHARPLIGGGEVLSFDLPHFSGNGH